MHTTGIRSIGAFLLLVISATLTPTASWPQARPRLVPSIDIQVPLAPTPVRIAGRQHLVYELHVTNFRSYDVALTRVEVLNADGKARLADLRDTALTSKLGRPGMRTDPLDRRVLAGGMRAVVYQWISLDDAVPKTLQHRIEFDLMLPSGAEHGTVEDSPIVVRSDAPPVLSPPLRGGPWVAVYDPLLERGHRTSIYTLEGRARIPARFAIDWMRMNEDGSMARGDDSTISNWHGYGAEVLAVANGVVADAKDDMPEPESLAAAKGAMPFENASGNYVTLDLGQGRYAFYEHLKHGSIKVRPGERVRSGQVIGQLGNSGSSSSGPHLHFHVGDSDAELAAEGLPYVFRSFEVIGAFDTLDAFARRERWKPAPETLRGTREMELPAAKTVVMFP